MALTSLRLLALASLAAALIAIALLPPAPDWWEHHYTWLQDSPTRVELARRTVGRAETRLHLLAMRDSALAILTRRPAGGVAIRPGHPVTDTLTPRQRRALETAWDSVIAALGPAVASDSTRMLAFTSTRPDATLYLLPPTTGGSCLVAVELGRWRRDVTFYRRLVRRALGPCAYYHAFGPPGSSILAWLEDAGFQPAYEADWEGSDGVFRRRGDDLVAEGRNLGSVIAAAWERPYLGSLALTACAAGQLAACRSSLNRPTPSAFRLSRWPALEAQRVFIRGGGLAPWWASESGYFLADLVRDHGRERFGRFWRSTLPVDSAFAAAYGVPLDRYISEWLRRDRTIRLGPLIRTSSVLLSLGFSALVVAAAALLTTRRQVS